jgi:hypothetical protein
MADMDERIKAQDSIVQAVIEKFLTRAEFGQKKYGTNLDRTDLQVKDWIQHAQEELMDGILYLEKLKKEINKPTNESSTNESS